MPFISEATHKQFLQHYHNLLERNKLMGEPIGEDECLQALAEDVTQLQQILQNYTATCLRLHEVVKDYQEVLRKARVNMRKIQLRAIPKLRVEEKSENQNSL